MDRLAEIDDLLICIDNNGLTGWRVGQIGKVTSFTSDNRIIRVQPLINPNPTASMLRSLWRDKLNNRGNDIPQFKFM